MAPLRSERFVLSAPYHLRRATHAVRGVLWHQRSSHCLYRQCRPLQIIVTACSRNAGIQTANLTIKTLFCTPAVPGFYPVALERPVNHNFFAMRVGIFINKKCRCACAVVGCCFNLRRSCHCGSGRCGSCRCGLAVSPTRRDTRPDLFFQGNYRSSRPSPSDC